MKKLYLVLIFALFAPHLQGMNQEQNSLKLETENVVFPDGSKKPCFKKPTDMTNQQFLFRLLQMGEFTKKVAQNELETIANTIETLCEADKTLLMCPISPCKTPLQYASYFCYLIIDKVLLKFKNINYIKRSAEQKECAKKNAETIGSQLAAELAKVINIGAPKELEHEWRLSEGELNNQDNNTNFSWQIKHDYTNGEHAWWINLYQGSTSTTCCCRIKCILGLSHKTNELDLYIHTLQTKEPYRQRGLGEGLLSATILFASQLKKNIKVYLIPIPDDKNKKELLRSYYKSFNLYPYNFDNLELHIDKNGDQIKPYEVISYLKKLKESTKQTNS